MATSAWAEVKALECINDDYRPENYMRITFDPELTSAEIQFLQNGKCDRDSIKEEWRSKACGKSAEVKVFPNFYRFAWTVHGSRSGDFMGYFNLDLSRKDLSYSSTFKGRPRNGGQCKLVEIDTSENIL